MQNQKKNLIQDRLKTLEKEREDKFEISKNNQVLDQFRTDFDKKYQVNSSSQRANTDRGVNKSFKNLNKLSFGKPENQHENTTRLQEYGPPGTSMKTFDMQRSSDNYNFVRNESKSMKNSHIDSAYEVAEASLD